MKNYAATQANCRDSYQTGITRIIVNFVIGPRLGRNLTMTSCSICFKVRNNWRKATIQPMILFVSFASSVLNNVIEEQIKELLCEKDANENPFWEPTNLTCESVISEPTIATKLNDWMLYKNLVQYVPAFVFAPLVALFF